MTEQQERSHRKPKGWRKNITRDSLIFFTGWLGILHQWLIVAETDRSLLILFAGMIGLPAVLGLDEVRKQ